MPCLGIVNFLMMNRNNLYSYSHPGYPAHFLAVCLLVICGLWESLFEEGLSHLPTFYVALVITLQVQSSTRLHQVRWYIPRRNGLGRFKLINMSKQKGMGFILVR